MSRAINVFRDDAASTVNDAERRSATTQRSEMI